MHLVPQSPPAAPRVRFKQIPPRAAAESMFAVCHVTVVVCQSRDHAHLTSSVAATIMTAQHSTVSVTTIAHPHSPMPTSLRISSLNCSSPILRPLALVPSIDCTVSLTTLKPNPTHHALGRPIEQVGQTCLSPTERARQENVRVVCCAFTLCHAPPPRPYHRHPQAHPRQAQARPP